MDSNIAEWSPSQGGGSRPSGYQHSRSSNTSFAVDMSEFDLAMNHFDNECVFVPLSVMTLTNLLGTRMNLLCLVLQMISKFRSWFQMLALVVVAWQLRLHMMLNRRLRLGKPPLSFQSPANPPSTLNMESQDIPTPRRATIAGPGGSAVFLGLSGDVWEGPIRMPTPDSPARRGFRSLANGRPMTMMGWDEQGVVAPGGTRMDIQEALNTLQPHPLPIPAARDNPYLGRGWGRSTATPRVRIEAMWAAPLPPVLAMEQFARWEFAYDDTAVQPSRGSRLQLLTRVRVLAKRIFKRS
ncbi:hypothetical protein EJ06DRAFT_530168 [Trichodelitschia bisporula]|uniref:Uncharacterized protein n=1 Tax=Trichodelitschia bisporula TaxID=703511 RepID=A0A6G1HW80_9PEZI|nr:hypothetical protein EJ06DRAFT_530168 [Trichodelitschia bisporula]